MRVGIVYLGRRGSGGPLSCELAKGLQRHASVFAILSENSESLTAWEESGIEHYTIPTYNDLPEAVLSWMRRANFQRLADMIRSKEPDILIYPMFYTWNPFLQREMRDIPAIVAVHDPVPHPGLQSNLFKLLEDISIRKASRCLIFSQGLIGSLEKRGVARDCIDVIPHGEINYYTYLPVPKEAPAPEKVDGETTLLFFGRISSYKGLDILLKAYRALASRPGLRLLIAGAGNLAPYHSLLDGLPNVELINRWIADDEVGSIFERSDIVVLPYTSASQSGVIALAAAYRLPVISTYLGGIPEQISDGISGMLVSPGSVSELREAIEELLDSPVDAQMLGIKLQEQFREDRNWDKIADLVYQSCLRVVGEKE